MATTDTRSPSRVMSLWAAGLVLMVAMLGHVLLSPPKATAQPALTHEESEYVALLAKGDPAQGIPPIGPAPNGTLWHLAQGGRAIAADLRSGITVSNEANTIVKADPYLTLKQALWEVVCAMVVFAPELVPTEQTPV
jgi:hypothetical protein